MSTWWRTDAVAWSAHGWTLELRGDELAEIRHGDRMLVRAVRAAVRDRGWMTVAVAVRGAEYDSESLTLQLRHEGLGARIDSVLRVTTRADELTIDWDATSATAFDTCRTGLVVLHPASDAGRGVSVTHSDGSVEDTAFPTSISPHQPIKDIGSLDLGDVSLAFAGDVFEMEDQRNWTDASFKTYSRPLGLPYPYALAAGERVHQSITLRVPAASLPTVADEGPAVFELVEAGAFPAIGVEASTAPDPVPASNLGAFRVVELNLTTPNWAAALDRAARDQVPLEVRVVADSASDLGALAQALVGRDVVRIAAFDAGSHISDAPLVAALRDALSAAGVQAPALAGARSHFTELNREQSRTPRDVDGIVLNTTPLFHTLDTEQLVEALAMQRLIAVQAVEIAGSLPVHIGPVSLRPRFNNVATTAEPAPTSVDLAEGYGAEFTGAVDERQRAPELAAWVIASAAALAVPGVATLSWFETWGQRGIADSSGSAPAADAVAALASLQATRLLSSPSPDGLVWALGASGDEDTVLVANLDRRPRLLQVRFPNGTSTEVEVAPGSWQRLRAKR